MRARQRKSVVSVGRRHGGTRMRAAGVLAACCGLGVSLLGGCAADTGKDDTIRVLTDRNAQLLREIEERNAAVQSLQMSLSQREGAIGDQTGLVGQLRAENERLRGRLSEVDRMLSGMEFGQIDPLTSRELERLAQQYPDVLSYDASRGLIRFMSDLTFDSGSAVVRDTARPTLERLASILNTQAGLAYDVRIVGHTDNQRISAATAQRHPTNMHLSAHRSISVFDSLRTMGVSSDRIEIAGRGEFAPVVPNNPTGGTSQNRRVDIYLVKFRDESPSPSSAGTQQRPAATPTRPTQQQPTQRPRSNEDDIMK